MQGTAKNILQGVSPASVWGTMIHLILNRKSQAYFNATHAGFTFSEPRISEDYFGGFSLRVDFKCVCHSEEIFNRAIGKDEIQWLMSHDPIFKDGVWDAVQEIENLGSFSAQHLRDDGFGEDDIKRIRYVYDLQDEVKRLQIIEYHYNAMIGASSRIYEGNRRMG
jgi:hypothetical protein